MEALRSHTKAVHLLCSPAKTTKMVIETQNLLKVHKYAVFFVCITEHMGPQDFTNHGVHEVCTLYCKHLSVMHAGF